MKKRTALLSLFWLALLAGLAYFGHMFWAGMQVHEVPTPLPDQADQVAPANQGPVGPQGDDDHMTKMKPMSVYVPAVGLYSPLDSTKRFVPSSRSNFNTIDVPNDPPIGVWYSKGSPLVGGADGYTTLAGHVSYNGTVGTFAPLYKTKPGNIVWTMDKTGQAQKWQVERIYARKHRAFPQEYWNVKPKGSTAPLPRRLVMVTCGGEIIDGHFEYNIFVVAHQV